MPATSRLSPSEVQRIEALIGAGGSNARIAREVGRSKQSIARVRAGSVKRGVTTSGPKFNVRVTREEYEAFRMIAVGADLTVSMAIRRLMRQAAGLLDMQTGEIDELAAARRELAAVGRNLNTLTKFAASGRMSWNAKDAAVVARTAKRVDVLAETFVLFVAAGRRKSMVLTEAFASGASQ